MSYPKHKVSTTSNNGKITPLALTSSKNDSERTIVLCRKEQEVQHHFHWDLIEGATIVGAHQHVQLKPITKLPNVKRMITLNNAPYEKHPEECAVCFYTKDTVIERIWNNPQRYVSVLKRFPLIIGLDFSILNNMYYPQQAYNCWRNYVMTYWLQKNFPVVVPNVGYGDSDTFPWVLEGLPENSWLAITTQGGLDSYVLKRMLLNGLHETVRQKHPLGLIVYGKFPDVWKERFSIPIIVFPSYREMKLEGSINGKR